MQQQQQHDGAPHHTIFTLLLLPGALPLAAGSWRSRSPAAGAAFAIAVAALPAPILTTTTTTGPLFPTRACLLVHDTANAQDLKIEAFGTNAVRIRVVPTGDQFYDSPDVVSAFDPVHAATASSGCPTAALSMGQSLIQGNLKAEVNADGRLVFMRVTDGKVLLTEQLVRTFVVANTTVPATKFYNLTTTFEAVVGERIYGLGQHAPFDWAEPYPKLGQLDNKNLEHPFLLTPYDGDITIPVAHSSRGYAFFNNLPSSGQVHYTDTESYWLNDACLQADMWVATTSDSPPHAVSPWQQLQLAWSDASGHSPVWPEWTTGFWQSKNRYSDQTQIMEVATEYVRRKIPLAMMVIDYYSWIDPLVRHHHGEHNTLGDEILPATCWPNPAQMVQSLKEMGIELMLSA